MLRLINSKKRQIKRAYFKAKRTAKKSVFKTKVSKRLKLPQYDMSERQLYVLTYLSTFVLISMVVGAFILMIALAVISRQLPNPNQLLERSYELSTKINDRNGKPIYEVYGEKNRTLVQLSEISPHVINATLAVEDANFYAHQGFSINGMLRAAKNTVTGHGLQGGSTLTQQVIKNTLLSQERTIMRKVKELILSLQLENRYSKDQILQMYLNESPYGGQNYGIYTAAEAYFNKKPSELTLAESAYLAGLPQRPSYYSQFGASPEAGIERKNTVLQLMHDKGWLGPDGNRYYISDEEYQSALNEQLNFQSSSIPFKAPHFVFYVKQKLIDLFGEDVVEQGGLIVKTSLDLDFQERAQEIVTEELDKLAGYNVYNGGLVAIDPKTGQILAMVGSKGYFLDSYPKGCKSGTTGEGSCLFEPELNTTITKRQPGSAIKPITYATMLKQGYTAAFPLLDVPTRFPGARADKPYEPVDYDGRYRGPMSVRKSLANSLNIPAVKALKIVGIDNMIKTAEDLGITTFTDRERYGLALTLGGGETKLLELTSAFSTFANKGHHYETTPILEVTDSKGNVLYNWQDTGGEKVLGEDVAFLISDILSDDGARSAIFGTGSLLNIPKYEVAVKTGTTDDKRDNYAIGFTPNVAIGVWVGNNNNEAMNPYIASGITGATPIWHNAMQAFLEKYYPDGSEEFVAPSNVEKMTVDELTGMLPYGDRSTRQEWFIKGTEPTSVSDWYKTLEICKKDGRIANDSCREADDTETKTYIDIQAALPEWQMYVDKWVSENYSGKDEYFPPKIKTCLEFNKDGDVKDSNNICAKIVNFKDGEEVPLDFRLSVEVSTANKVDHVNVYMDGNEITSDKSEPYGYNFELSADQIGTHKFKVVAHDNKGNEADDEISLDVVGYQLD
jgi:penicillin-binding protein 1C